MAGESASARGKLDQALGELAQLRQFTGPALEFWPRFLAAVQQLTTADQLTMLIRKTGQPWRRVAEWGWCTALASGAPIASWPSRW